MMYATMLPGCHNAFNRFKPDVKPPILAADGRGLLCNCPRTGRKSRRGRQLGIKSNDTTIKVTVFGLVLAVYHHHNLYRTFIALRLKMRYTIVIIVATVCCFLVLRATAEEAIQQNQQLLNLGSAAIEDQVDGGAVHTREKRTLFLKKKLLGAGLLGFGLGIAKGYKAGYYSAPDVHHVYLSQPPVKYVEYVEKPVYIERIVPKPLYKPHIEYSAPVWSQPDSSYGAW